MSLPSRSVAARCSAGPPSATPVVDGDLHKEAQHNQGADGDPWKPADVHHDDLKRGGLDLGRRLPLLLEEAHRDLVGALACHRQALRRADGRRKAVHPGAGLRGQVPRGDEGRRAPD
eukprot:CAMPEP_0197901186 /NCGR_PEP_ID=MMETSP1439-20131203/50873_1 /TAXON_ID=66791 /ORGANISM="Gonyaulax spinifera, Strain CCMP409" /LENGTH=116 /DNA_ID=CAMNT_0043522147 /DNA_START=119 /DNA_END=469 /DNA_ORIENTATION=-